MESTLFNSRILVMPEVLLKLMDFRKSPKTFETAPRTGGPLELLVGASEALCDIGGGGLP